MTIETNKILDSRDAQIEYLRGEVDRLEKEVEELRAFMRQVDYNL